MLTELYLKNYILIPELRLSFKPGMTAITGETGAGKSIILGALNLVFAKSTAQQIAYNPAQDVYLEITFNIPQECKEVYAFLDETGISMDDNELLISREFTVAGKTSSYINGRKTSVSVLKELHDLLIDFHHQRDQQSLLNSAFQLELLDQYGSLIPLRTDFQNQLSDLRNDMASLKSLQDSESSNQQLMDLYRFQIDELSSASLTIGEDIELEQEFELLSHSEDIITLASELYSTFYDQESSLYDLLVNAQNRLEKYSAVSVLIGETCQKLETGIESIQEASNVLRSVKERIVTDPERLINVKQRLDLFNTLKTKYKHNSLEELIAYRNSIEQKVKSQENNQAEIEALNILINSKFAELINTADRLSAKRRSAALELSANILENIKQLSLENARLEIQIDKKAEGKILLTELNRFFNDTGQDVIEIRFSANPDSPVLPLKSIVSGGELSRILLAAKRSLTQVLPPRTIILDEIDVGIGGKTAGALAVFIHKLAQNHQVLCITHLAKIAAIADDHISIEKKIDSGSTVIKVMSLDAEHKINEIARMLSGHDTELSVKHAKELINIIER